jgi:hypothetical protein
MIFNFFKKKKNLLRLHTDICNRIENKSVKLQFENNTWIAEFDEDKGVLVLNHYTSGHIPLISYYETALKKVVKKDIIVKTNMYYE